MRRATFSVLFYANKSKVKDGIVPVMGRITINGTQSQFSCKRSIPLSLWDAKGNCAKGRTREALDLNRDLDNIKAQIIKHYQHLADREAFVTALAFVDVKNLTTDDIVDINGDKWIVSHRRI